MQISSSLNPNDACGKDDSAAERRRLINRESARRTRARKVADADTLRRKNSHQERKIDDLNEQITALQKENTGLLQQNSKLVEQNMLINEDLRMCLSSNNCMLAMPRPLESPILSPLTSLPALKLEEGIVTPQMLARMSPTSLQQRLTEHSPMTPSGPAFGGLGSPPAGAMLLGARHGLEGYTADLRSDIVLPLLEDFENFP